MKKILILTTLLATFSCERATIQMNPVTKKCVNDNGISCPCPTPGPTYTDGRQDERLDNLEKEQQIQKEQILDLKNQMESINALIAGLQSQVNIDNAEYKTEITNIQNGIIELFNEVNNLDRFLTKEEYYTQKAEIMNAIADLNLEMNSLHADIELINIDIADLIERLNNLNIEIVNINTQINSLSEENNNQNEQINENINNINNINNEITNILTQLENINGVEIKNICANEGEILIKIGNKYVAYYAVNGAANQSHLRVLKENTTYQTTDEHKCNFKIVGGNIVRL